MSDATNFSVSDDFEMFEAKAEGALKEQRQAERRTMGFPLEVGVKGRCVVTSVKAGKSKENVDQKTGEKSGGNPQITMEFQVVTPEEKKGTKLMRWFTFYDTAKMTYAQRYAMWLDFMEGVGLPREIRENGKTKDVLGWLAAQPREFEFEIVADDFGLDKKNIRPIFTNNQPLPGATATSAAMQAAGADWKQDEDGTFAGTDIKFLNYVDGTDKKKANILVVATNKSTTVDTESLKKKA